MKNKGKFHKMLNNKSNDNAYDNAYLWMATADYSIIPGLLDCCVLPQKFGLANLMG